MAHEHRVHPVLRLQRRERLEGGEGGEVPEIIEVRHIIKLHVLKEMVQQAKDLPEQECCGRADPLDARREELPVDGVDDGADPDAVGEGAGHAREGEGELGHSDQRGIVGTLRHFSASNTSSEHEWLFPRTLLTRA